MIYEMTPEEQKEFYAVALEYYNAVAAINRKQDKAGKNAAAVKDCTAEYERISSEYNAKLEELDRAGYARRFKEIENDPQAILDSAKEQIPLTAARIYDALKSYTLVPNEQGELVPNSPDYKLDKGFVTRQIKRELQYHFNALDSDKERKHELREFLSDYLNGCTWIKQNTTKTPPTKKTDFLNMPTSAYTDMIFEALAFGDDLSKLPGRKNLITHNASYTVKESKGKNARQVIKSNKNSEMIVEASDIDKLLGSNKAAKKIFVLSLMKANEQAVYNGELVRDFVDFPLHELVDRGLYKSVRTARVGFNAGSDVLTSLKIKGHETKKGKNMTATDTDALRVLYTGAQIENGQCYLFLNSHVNWETIIQFFTIIPQYYFELPNRASDLLYYIFYLARQNTKKIEKQGYFTISFRAIQERLQLPSEAKAKNPGRDIKQPIETAIEQIEKAHSAYYHNTEFQLLPVNDDLKNTTDFLDRGYLKVTLLGQFSKNFIELSKAATQKTNEREKRQKQIVDKAKSISLADSMKST